MQTQPAQDKDSFELSAYSPYSEESSCSFQRSSAAGGCTVLRDSLWAALQGNRGGHWNLSEVVCSSQHLHLSCCPLAAGLEFKTILLFLSHRMQISGRWFCAGSAWQSLHPEGNCLCVFVQTYLAHQSPESSVQLEAKWKATGNKDAENKMQVNLGMGFASEHAVLFVLKWQSSSSCGTGMQGYVGVPAVETTALCHWVGSRCSSLVGQVRRWWTTALLDKKLPELG